jgi:hypothetical protein
MFFGVDNDDVSNVCPRRRGTPKKIIRVRHASSLSFVPSIEERKSESQSSQNPFSAELLLFTVFVPATIMALAFRRSDGDNDT